MSSLLYSIFAQFSVLSACRLWLGHKRLPLGQFSNCVGYHVLLGLVFISSFPNLSAPGFDP